MPDALRERGARVDVLALYETVPEPLSERALRQAQTADYITFTSSSSVRYFFDAPRARAGHRAFEDIPNQLPDDKSAPGQTQLSPATRIVSIGPVTSATLREHGLEPHVEAEPHDVDGLVQALLSDALATHQKGLARGHAPTRRAQRSRELHMTPSSDRDQSESPPVGLGYPRIHLRRTDSTNERARRLAIAGAAHGTAVTAGEQSAGRGRQGRSWLAPPGSALLCSLILRDPPPLLSLIAGVAVCDVVGDDARVKWPNDVVLERLCPDEQTCLDAQLLSRRTGTRAGGNRRRAALRPRQARRHPRRGAPSGRLGCARDRRECSCAPRELPAEVRAGAASLNALLAPSSLFLNCSTHFATGSPSRPDALLDAWRVRDALYGRVIAWDAHSPQSQGERGRAEGIDDGGQLLVRREGRDDDGAQRRRGSLGAGRLIGPLQRLFYVLLQLLA